MFYKDYYPAGAANDTKAPYNQVEAEEKTFDVDIACTLYCTGTFKSDEYEGGYFDKDEREHIPAEYNGTISKAKAWEEQNITPLELIMGYKTMLQKQLSIVKQTDALYPSNEYKKEIQRIKVHINACSLWVKEEVEEA